MKKFLSGISLALVMIFALNSCADPENSELLTDGIWKFSDLTTDSEDQDIQGLIFLMKAFMTDSRLEFKDNGEFILSYADALGEDPSTGTWELIGDDVLTFISDDAALPPTANIQDLSEDKLKFLAVIPDQELGNINVTFSWRR